MYKIYVCSIAFLLFTASLHAQSADSLVAGGMQLEKAMQETAALQQYKAAVDLDSNNLKALCRASILSTREGSRQASSKKQEPYFRAAAAFAKRALRNNPDDKYANLAMAIALRSLSLNAGAKEKAGYIKEVKTYVDKALLIDSTYARAWHVLGNWNYEVSTLSFAGRAAAKLLFGGLPDASIDRAVTDYLQCQRFDPSFIRNVYDLAIAWHAQGKDLRAIATLKQALRLRPSLQGDREILDDCRKMLRALQ